MRFYSISKPVWILLLHLIAGAALAYRSELSTLWGVGAFFYFFIATLVTRNRTGYAHLGAAYIVGLEVLLRMTRAAVFWEFGKWAGIFLLITGIFLQYKRRKYQWSYLVILLLLSPGIFSTVDQELTYYRQLFSAQLAGPILLVISAVYFGGKIVEVSHVQKIFRALLNPVAATLAYLFVRTPSLSSIYFTMDSNFAASGGFGPNQVSTILGLGFLVFAFNYLAKWDNLYSGLLDKVFMGLTSFRALLTFSRGGIISALGAILAGYFTVAPVRRHVIHSATRLLLAAVLLYSVYMFADNVTGHVLSRRFAEKTFGPATSSVSLVEGDNLQILNKITSNRVAIMISDIKMWLDHPFWGVGVGKSKLIRPVYGETGAPHTEQTRLLAEHGILGAIVLLWMLYVVVSLLFERKSMSRFFALTFILFSFFTMLHSATRLAIVGFSFGLGLVRVYSAIKS